jgi:hypothetical protein
VDAKTKAKLFWTGLALYGASFLLVAVVGTGPGRGYSCAFQSIFLSLADVWARLTKRPPYLTQDLLESFALLVSGLINFAFLLYVLVIRLKPNDWAVIALRLAVPLMIPFCWIVFYYEDFYPREGHFLWILGMLLVLFSDKFTASSPARQMEASLK